MPRGEHRSLAELSTSPSEQEGTHAELVREARQIVDRLPAANAGRCVLDDHGELTKASPQELLDALSRNRIRFHEGRIRGAFPELRGAELQRPG